MKKLGFGIIALLFGAVFMNTEQTEASGSTTYEVGVSVLHVRDAPAANGKIVGLLHQGDQLTTFGEKYGWVQTYYAGEVAWVAKHFLSPVSGETQVAGETTAEGSSAQVTITAPSVHIRTGPGEGYQAIAGTGQGETFPKIGSSGDWINISLGNKGSGWVASWLTDTASSPPPAVPQETEKTSKQPAITQTASAETAEPAASGATLAGRTIVIDAGHGGRDPGAIGANGIYEKDLVLETTTKIAAALRQYGAHVVETRTSDYSLSLSERAGISNANGADAFVSVHYNSFPVVSVQGINTFYRGEQASSLASKVHSRITQAAPLHNRGISPADFKVLRETSAPGILLELGFISNAYDLSVIQTADYQYKAAEAIAQGFIDYFN